MEDHLILFGRVLPISSPPIADGAVVVRAGKIEYVGSAARAPRYSNAEEIEVTGAILPGLIDAHVHLVASGGSNFRAEVDGFTRDELVTKAKSNAWRSLQSGITTLRDLGAPQGVAVSIARSGFDFDPEGSDVVAAGRAITAPGGHIAYLGVEAKGTAELADAAAHELRAGADGIKLVATGGVLTPTGVAVEAAPYDEDELAAAAEVALSEGKWVAAHGIGLEGTKSAIKAGATSIEHGIFLDRESVDLMATHGTILVSTRIAIVRMLEHRDHVPPDYLHRVASIGDRYVESLKLAAKAGIPIAGASDAGTPFNPHGGVAGEAELLVRDVGLTNASALESVTSIAARALRRDDLGHISEGAPANLIATAEDPLDDITAIAHVVNVVKNGRLIRSTRDRKYADADE
ncbi:hypothetical protein SD37_09410 [Amycolatopsis orientalis]|uniref:Amidohydrolase-related domain-containing protein n=1 Tax=Amycolatopsis orientalis TaxID=31958 RepID=A0A193BUJ3_AMYOR|nr:amidohydrolase family protein [Amycolatopsis orientalis]ANN15844.1 hypothetical protein SD37_09410 [Amycolatopsis orientalis]